jgi:hypothetical protein
MGSATSERKNRRSAANGFTYRTPLSRPFDRSLAATHQRLDEGAKTHLKTSSASQLASRENGR